MAWTALAWPEKASGALGSSTFDFVGERGTPHVLSDAAVFNELFFSVARLLHTHVTKDDALCVFFFLTTGRHRSGSTSRHVITILPLILKQSR